MGSCVSRSAQTVFTGSNDFPNVPADVASQVFLHCEAAPSFTPQLISVELQRGEFATVGASWIETRRFRSKQIRVRKSITKLSMEPYLKVSEVMEAIDPPCCVPTTIGTFTVAIEPYDNGKSCRVVWNDVFLSIGLWSRIVMTLLLPCLRSEFIKAVEDELQCIYEETLRQTLLPVKTATDNTANLSSAVDEEQTQLTGSAAGSQANP